MDDINTIETSYFVIIWGMLLIKNIQVSYFTDEDFSEVRITLTTLLNGIQIDKKTKIFWSYEVDDWTDWFELPEDMVQDIVEEES